MEHREQKRLNEIFKEAEVREWNIGLLAVRDLAAVARNEKEFLRIAAYVEENPVSAGLAATPEGWPWSSAATAS